MGTNVWVKTKTTKTLFLIYVTSFEYEIQIQKAQKAKIQQRKSPVKSQPREGNRAVRQAGQYETIESAQVEEGLRQETE